MLERLPDHSKALTHEHYGKDRHEHVPARHGASKVLVIVRHILRRSIRLHVVAESINVAKAHGLKERDVVLARWDLERAILRERG